MEHGAMTRLTRSSEGHQFEPVDTPTGTQEVNINPTLSARGTDHTKQ